MTTPLPLTDRQQREEAYYARYAPLQQVQEVDFAPVESSRLRPWNPYWRVYQHVRAQATGRPQRLLDFGCGTGLAALRFARLGLRVDGFDLSQANLDIASRLARQHGLEDRCRFHRMVAEHLAYPEATFDFVVGIDILHHVEVPQAVAEAWRVLKPGGVAIFKEHVEVPIYDGLRNTRLARRLVPNQASLDDHITEDEHKLRRHEVQAIRRQFGQVEVERFTLLSRLERLMPGGAATRGWLQRLDHGLLRCLPPLRHLGGTAIFVCRKPRLEAAQATMNLAA